MWALGAPGAGGSGVSMWAGVAASQCYILARLIVKLHFLASETAFFQRSLAHWGYTAAPVVVRPVPPIVEFQWAAAGATLPLGRRMMRINGSSIRKIPPISRNSHTNDTIDPCCS